jgi:uncharacterized protein (DUF433 family)
MTDAEHPARDFARDYRDLLARRSQPIVPAVVGRLVGDLLDEVGRLRARAGEGLDGDDEDRTRSPTMPDDFDPAAELEYLANRMEGNSSPPNARTIWVTNFDAKKVRHIAAEIRRLTAAQTQHDEDKARGHKYRDKMQAEIDRLRARVAGLEAGMAGMADPGPTIRELDIDDLIQKASEERAGVPDFDRLVFDFDVSDVSPVVKGTWVTSDHVVSLVVDGHTWDDILRAHPELTGDDIRACLAYHLDQTETA